MGQIQLYLCLLKALILLPAVLFLLQGFILIRFTSVVKLLLPLHLKTWCAPRSCTEGRARAVLFLIRISRTFLPQPEFVPIV